MGLVATGLLRDAEPLPPTLAERLEAWSALAVRYGQRAVDLSCPHCGRGDLDPTTPGTSI